MYGERISPNHDQGEHACTSSPYPPEREKTLSDGERRMSLSEDEWRVSLSEEESAAIRIGEDSVPIPRGKCPYPKRRGDCRHPKRRGDSLTTEDRADCPVLHMEREGPNFTQIRDLTWIVRERWQLRQPQGKGQRKEESSLTGLHKKIPLTCWTVGKPLVYTLTWFNLIAKNQPTSWKGMRLRRFGNQIEGKV